MSYHHKSGYQKRKEKTARDETSKKGQTTLSSFLKQTSVGDRPTAAQESASSSSSGSGTSHPQPQIVIEHAHRPIITSLHSQASNEILEVPINTGSVVVIQELSKLQQPSRETKDANAYKKQTEMHTSELPITEKTDDIQIGFRALGTTKNYDLGNIKSAVPSPAEIRVAVQSGPFQHPSTFPRDSLGRKFPVSVLKKQLENGEFVQRIWLVWSNEKKTLHCFCCRLFYRGPDNAKPAFASLEGVSSDWRRLYFKINEHERSPHHKTSYIEWKSLEKRLISGNLIDEKLSQELESEVLIWRSILRRILHVILFLSERGLPLRGDSDKIGDPNNGNFLGILELLSHYDDILREHITKVKEAQQGKQRLQVTYLSNRIQNEFIELCADKVRCQILKELKEAKYYSLIVDSTPDSSHLEQHTFVLRYIVSTEKNGFVVLERFFDFINLNKKTGESIAGMILDTLKNHDIDVLNCRGQGYDNAANMSGRFKGTQSILLKENELAVYSPCACHSLNLCGKHAAECCIEATTYFGVVQTVYAIFSASVERWAILKENTGGDSLHSLSTTRWSARIQSVKPFANHLPGILTALDHLVQQDLSAEVKAEVNGCIKYIKSPECVIMSSIWFKILSLIEYRSKILQARQCTVDVEMDNIEGLLNDLTELRKQWTAIQQECQVVCTVMDMDMEKWSREPETNQRKRKRKRFFDEDSDSDVDANHGEVQTKVEKFQINVFYVMVDRVIMEMRNRYQAVKELNEKFCFLWQYLSLDDDKLQEKAKGFVQVYSKDVNLDLAEEVIFLKKVHHQNLGDKPLHPVNLLKKLHEEKLEELFPNVCIALRVFCTIPVSVAEGERSFSTMARLKNMHRSTMGQIRLTSLGLLSLENKLAREIDYNDVINTFADKKARKVNI